ncbi:xylulokinase [Pseudonocardia alaniniphila]|uniref:FGGY family carbohydrate kinase n=1 Tax=Pseudonocardia alaniniphila TaxID=75291 RepID=A0ABS9T8Q8_9PSEU|nr:FGGY family carbohydrate kinase [Pseudonocardia alaniniphila]MCH6164914.1 FGGY family carbohydrate kinase [Pseudonocardia alaniniphila]
MDTRVMVVDAGTSAVKAAVLHDAQVVASSEVALAIDRPAPGHAEQSPDAWWEAFVAAVRKCVTEGPAPEVIAITGQMQDLVLLDGRGRSIRPALLYADHRATAELSTLFAEIGPTWHQATGNVADPSSSAAQLRWMSEHEPSALERTREIVLGSPGLLVRRATGEHVCDLTTASTTGLLDIGASTWWSPVLAALGVDEGRLPRLVDGATVTGRLDAGPAAELGLPSGLPLVHAAGDVGAATAGLVGDQRDTPNVSLGTSGGLATITDSTPGPNGALHRMVGPRGEGSILIGSLLSAGATLDWARRTYLPGCDHTRADELAAAAGPTDLLMLPSLAGERSPVRDATARGAVIGLRPTTTPAELYRAALEAIAYSLREIAALMPSAAGVDERPIPLSGGAGRSLLLRQIIADVLGRPVLPVAAHHASLIGAQRAAALALGEPVPASAMETVDRSAVLQPGPQRHHYDALASAHAQLWQALSPSFTAIASLRSAPPRS